MPQTAAGELLAKLGDVLVSMDWDRHGACELLSKHVSEWVAFNVSNADPSNRDLPSPEITRFADSVSMPIIGIDMHGVVTVWNRHVASLSDFSKEEVLGLDVHESCIDMSIAHKLSEACRGVNTTNFDMHLDSKNSERFALVWNTTRLENADGRTIGAIAVGTDMTECLTKRHDDMEAHSMFSIFT